MNARNRFAIWLLFGISCVLGSCKSLELPEPGVLGMNGRSVRFDRGTSNRPRAFWQLIDGSSVPLATAPSLFSFAIVGLMGVPAEDRLTIEVSDSGNTILVHEDASDSSPTEQIVIFSKGIDSNGTEIWSVRRKFPPHRPGPSYGVYGESIAVDDRFLFYRFLDGPAEKIRFSSLQDSYPADSGVFE